MNNYKYETEQQILKKFHMKDFRNMSKDKFIKMASIMDKIDPEVAKQIVGQFPNFKELASNTLLELGNNFSKVIKSDDDAFDKVLDFYSKELTILNELLSKYDGNIDDAIIILDRIKEINDDIKLLHSEHMRANIIKYGMLAIGGVGSLCAGLSALGVDVKIPIPDKFKKS